MVAVFTVFLLLISGCQTANVKTQNEIMQDMNMKTAVKKGYIKCHFVEDDDYTVDKFEIMRRQTNTEKKEDIVIGNATIKNSYFSTVIVCKLIYNNYNGDWILDDCEFLTEDTKPISYPLKGIDPNCFNFDYVCKREYEREYGELPHGSGIDSFDVDLAVTRQDFYESDNGWINTIVYTKEKPHYTYTAVMEFIFDQQSGWIIDKNAHDCKKYNSPRVVRIDYDFSVLTGTFATSNGYELIIDSYDEDSNIVRGSYKHRFYNNWIEYNNFTAYFNKSKMQLYNDDFFLYYQFACDGWSESSWGDGVYERK